MTAPEIITHATLVTWKGTDAELARSLGVTPQAVQYARTRHGLPRVLDGRKGPRKGLSRSVKRAVKREAERRGVTLKSVCNDLGVWVEEVEE